jgi:hypothetical protein
MEIAQLALNNNHSLTHSFIKIELTAYDVYCLSNIIGWTLFRVKPNNVKLIVILLYYTHHYMKEEQQRLKITCLSSVTYSSKNGESSTYIQLNGLLY